MILKKLTLAGGVALLAASPAQAGDQVLIGPVPDWVEPAAAASDDKDSSLPVRILLLDNQQRMEGDRRVIYTSMAMKFQTPQGLSGGNLSFPWRADSDELTVHKVVIHRGDQDIDVLASGQTFTVLRREQNLEMAMLDGVLTANMFPEGLQVGDVLEFATTIVSTDPVLAGHGEAALGPLNAPIGRVHLRIQWPGSARMQLAKTDDLPEWKRTREGGFESAELTLENIEPIPVPDAAPLRYNMVRFAQASDYASWAELADIFVPLYQTAAKVSADGPLRAEVERIRSASSDPVARAEAALQLVESRIRYVALAMGDGGLVPANATDTWSRRYGDCKAKTALLLAILGELGIEAEPVIVNSAFGDTLSERLPSPSAFDHVIVRAHVDGRVYWLDGTRTGDTSLARLQVPRFEWGLPIRPGAELVRMIPPPLTEPNQDIAIRMDATKGVRVPAPTTIELTLRGDSALGMNQAMANFVGEARDRTLREYWRRRFRDLEPGTVGMAFDEATGEMKLTVEGSMTLHWDGVWYETDETGVGYLADFTREPGYASDAPYTLDYPYFSRTRQTIVLPAGFTGTIDEDSEIDETVAGIEYKRHETLTGTTVFIEKTERSIAPEFAARDAPAAQKRLRELYEKAVYLRMPSNYRPTEADLAVLLADVPQSAQGFVSQGTMLMDAGRHAEALPKFERAAELEPQNVWAWANRGVALARLRKPQEAQEALDKAAGIDPNNWVIYNGYGILAEWRRDFPAAAEFYKKGLELNPQNRFARGSRVQALVNGGQADLALGELAEQVDKDPHLIEAYGLRFLVQMMTGHRDRAPAEVQALLAANPDSPQAKDMAGRLYNELGMTEEARALLGDSMPATPSPFSLLSRAGQREPRDTEGRLADLGEALTIDPSFIPALMTRAQTYYGAARYDEALADTAEVIRRDPKISDAYLLRANIFRSMGRRDDALAEAEAIVSANPDEAFAHVAAGKIYSNFGMREQALAAIDLALAIRPEPYIYVNRSEVRDPADVAARLADLDEALRLAPSDPSTIAVKARLLSETGDNQAAAAILAQGVEGRPNDAYLLTSRGIALWRLGRRDEAESDFAHAREQVSDAIALNGLCYTKAEANVALDRALAECEESLRLRPDVAATLDSRGAVLLRLGRLDEAIRDFDRALEQYPTLNNSRYLRAVARSQQGEFAAAQADLAQVREANPELIGSMERNDFVVLQRAEGTE